MKRLNIIVLIMLWCCIGCKSSKSTLTPAQVESFNNLVTSKAFEIESDYAYPRVTNAMSQILNSQLFIANGSNASVVNLIGNANFLKIKGDSVFSYLPYFGERQMQIDYSAADGGAIQLKSVMKDYKVEQNKDDSKTISFSASSNNENFDVFIRLFQNLSSEMVLNSVSRFSIRYQGKVSPLKNDNKQNVKLTSN